MIGSHRRPRFVPAAAVALLVPLSLAPVACDGDDGDDDDVTPTVVDELDSDGDVPFDPDVDPGVGTDTDERPNQGFESDEPGEVGNVVSPNDPDG